MVNMGWCSRAVLALVYAGLVSAQEEHPIFSKSSNDSLLWGPYRSNLYFGIRPRVPKSITTALLWGRVEDYRSVQNVVRYTCEQNQDMGGYGWDKYDPRTGGVQTINDKGNGIDMVTSFVKFDEGRGGWGARIAGTVRDDAEPGPGTQGDVKEDLKTSVWFTVGMEGLGTLEVAGAEAAQDLGFDRNVVINGQTTELGDFRLTITDPAEGNKHPHHRHPSFQSKPIENTLVHSLQVPDEALWQSKPLIFSSIKTTIDEYVEEYTEEKMPPPWQTYTIQNQPGIGNFHMIQKTFSGSFSFDIFYTPASAKTPTADELTKQIAWVTDAFDTRFKSHLNPEKPFTDQDHVTFSKSLFSNLLGGLGYFHGTQVIDRSYNPDYDEDSERFHFATAEARALAQATLEGPYTLYTLIPSRPFFPRGFLWDEGFHLMPVVQWDTELVIQILDSWFKTMDEDGWIPREQILGSEARSKVPAEFQVQYPHYANPPTLFMVLERLLDNAEENGGDRNAEATLRPWLRQVYPLLQRHFEWYRKTQSGDMKSYDRPDSFSAREAYRWRGRTPELTLTSGLDDYPRPQPPHPGELHVDLMSWMGMMSRAMNRVSSFLGEHDDSLRYSKIADAIRRNIDDLHWSEKDKAYCDATIDEYEEHTLICHKGYISLFPFMTGMLDAQHEHLGDVLDLIGDEEKLWSDHGIRSLSKSDVLYGAGENYWCGPVWMPMNYLILRELLNVVRSKSPHHAKATKLYSELRKNLVDTVYESWKETGFAWEQYNSETGKGQRTRHFTGWTSLVVEIMRMPDVVDVGRIKDEL